MEELKRKIEGLNKDNEAKLEEYISKFEESFELDLEQKRKERPILVDLFENYALTKYKPSKLYKTILSNLVKLEDEIENTYGKEEKLIFNKWIFLQDRLHSDELLQMFVYGYCFCYEMQEESKKKNKF